MTGDAFIGDLHRRLDRAAPFELIEVLEAALIDDLGAASATLLLADYGESTLEEVPRHGRAETTESFTMEETRAGVTYRSQTHSVESREDEWVVHLPVSIRADRLGVLEVVMADEPSASTVALLGHAATVGAYAIGSARRYTDLFERVRRRRHLSLAAELQWDLLPVMAHRAPEFFLGGQLEPAYEVGGDTFDYAAERDRLTLAVTDAVGHGLRSALMGGLGVVAMRNARRAGGDLLAQAEAANDAIYRQFGQQYFFTALLMTVDLATGDAQVVNAGHSFLWRVRDGQASIVPLDAELPIGLFPDVTYGLQPVDVRQGDRFILLTDGVLEASPTRRAEPFGQERVERLLEETTTMTPPETARHLVREVVKHQSRELDDDATVLCVDFLGFGLSSR
jgi:serine phosphatase RsbU (regulator of sigma subunit)